MNNLIKTYKNHNVKADLNLNIKTDELSRDFYRLDARERRILIIGSETKHSVTSLTWLEEWPKLTDFDVVVVDLSNLDRATLVRLSRQDKTKLVRMRDQLFELIFSKGEIYCILAPFLSFGSCLYFADGSLEPEWSNLKWSPLGFSLSQAKGEANLVEGEVEFEEYLSQVSEASVYINNTANLNYIKTRLQKEGRLSERQEVFWHSIPLAVNRYNKPLAASICFGVREKLVSGEDSRISYISDSLHLLPPPNKISVGQGIELLIEQIKGFPAQTLVPDWAELYAVPGEEKLAKQISDMTRKIKAAERAQKKLFQNYRALQKTKALLFERGDNLKRIAVEVFRRLGFSIKIYALEPRLLVLHTRYGDILLATAGRSGAAEAGDLQTLLKHTSYTQSEDEKVYKGILIFNHYRLQDPAQDRPLAFSAEVVSISREAKLGLLTAEGLYTIFCTMLKGSMLKEELEINLYQKAGIIFSPIN